MTDFVCVGMQSGWGENMDNLLIVGAGQYGMVVRDIAQAMGTFGKIDFLDDTNPIAIGRISDLVQFHPAYSVAAVAIGRPELRLTLLERAAAAGFRCGALIHPMSVVSPAAEIADGCVVEPMAVVNAYAVLERGCIISSGAVVNHNCRLAQGVHCDCLSAVMQAASVPALTKIQAGTVFR